MHVETLQSAKVPRRFREVKREGDFKYMICVSVMFLERIQGYHNEHVVCMLHVCKPLSLASQRASQLRVLVVMPPVPVLANREDGLQKWAGQLREAKELVTRRCF